MSEPCRYGTPEIPRTTRPDSRLQFVPDTRVWLGGDRSSWVPPPVLRRPTRGPCVRTGDGSEGCRRVRVVQDPEWEGVDPGTCRRTLVAVLLVPSQVVTPCASRDWGPGREVDGPCRTLVGLGSLPSEPGTSAGTQEGRATTLRSVTVSNPLPQVGRDEEGGTSTGTLPSVDHHG